MHAETYTLILPYFQYICKLFDFKFLQKKTVTSQSNFHLPDQSGS